MEDAVDPGYADPLEAPSPQAEGEGAPSSVASALGGPASENGRLCHGDGATKGATAARGG